MENLDNKVIDFNEFALIYKPKSNHIDNNASFDGEMYETYGLEIDFVHEVNTKHPDKVWTVIDCDDMPVIASGFHFVNRLGYIITENGVNQGQEITVSDDDY
jgi:hypothetical protein